MKAQRSLIHYMLVFFSIPVASTAIADQAADDRAQCEAHLKRSTRSCNNTAKITKGSLTGCQI
jgi:hypothetical protein